MKKILWSLWLVFLTVSAFSDTSVPQDPVLSKIGLDQNIGASLPLNLMFRDETGRRVRLKRYFGTQPVILVFVYYQCPMLCPETLHALTQALRKVSYRPGDQFKILTVSIDPREGSKLAAAQKRMYVKSYGRPGAEEGWTFLT